MNHKNQNLKGNLALLIGAVIWGSAFVAQSAGMEYVGPFTYNMARSFIGFLVLIPVVIYFRRKRYSIDPLTPAEKKSLNKNTVIAGICCGIILCVASCLQQIGISGTTAGKAGFITALYIILVPIFGIVIGRKVTKSIWLCVVIALIGFYLLSIKEGFTISYGDFFCLLCAVAFSMQILMIDHFTATDIDGIMLSCVQFLVSGVLSLIPAFLFETPTFGALMDAKVTILYAGVLSSGVAYTLQIIGQKYAEPATASLLMSLESVFAAVFGWIILHESLSPRELLGCLLVFLAVILAQIPLPFHRKEILR